MIDMLGRGDENLISTCSLLCKYLSSLSLSACILDMNIVDNLGQATKDKNSRLSL